MHLFALMRSHWSKTRTHHDDCCLNLDVSFEKCCEIIQHTPPKKLTCPLKKSWDWKTRPAFPFWNGPRVILQSQSQPAMTSIPSEPEPRHVPLVRTIPRAASAWQWISGWIIACKVVIVPWIGGLFSCWLDGWDLGKKFASWPAKSSLSFKEDVFCKDRFEKLGSYFPTATDCFMTISCSWRLETLFTL